MEIKKRKCASIEHEEIDAIIFCSKCGIYMCYKCEIFHSKLFKNHKSLNIDKDNESIFLEFCQEENHNIELKFFCRTHNKLCCAACIAKIKLNEIGNHKDCNVCILEEIKEEKKNKLKKNINYLEELSKVLNESINDLKIYFEKISKNKEELKQIVQKVFTKIRNELNNREDELLLDIDNQFNDLFFNEEIIRESEKLPSKIKFLLEKGKKFEKEWNNNNKLCFYINNCLSIENDIKKIEHINEEIKKCKDFNDSKFIFDIEEEKTIHKYLEQIKSFDKIINIKNCLFSSFLNESSIIKELIQIKTIKKLDRSK